MRRFWADGRRFNTGSPAAGVHALAPLGSTGVLPYLTDDEREAVAETVVKRVAGRVPTLVGVSSLTTERTVHHARHAEEVPPALDRRGRGRRKRGGAACRSNGFRVPNILDECPHMQKTYRLQTERVAPTLPPPKKVPADPVGCALSSKKRITRRKSC